MAMTGEGLKLAMKATMEAEGIEWSAAMEKAWGRLGDVLINYIITNAVVVGTATGALGGGPGVPVVGSLT